MPLYSSVCEDYDVQVFRNLKEVCEAHAHDGLYIASEEVGENESPVPATAYAIKKRLRAESEVRLSEDGDRD